MLSNPSETLYSSTKFKEKQVTKFWSLLLNKEKFGTTMQFPECLENTPFSAKTIKIFCLQTMMLVDQLRRLTANKPRIQLLLCGDFNSLPDSGNWKISGTFLGAFWGLSGSFLGLFWDLFDIFLGPIDVERKQSHCTLLNLIDFCQV